MAKQQIEAKPTVYRGVAYQSRLEARWAILLDNCKNIVHFAYQPKTFKNAKGWEYTPDFRVRYAEAPNNHSELYMEIKPAIPNDDYMKELKGYALVMHKPLLVVCGSIYKDSFISSWLIDRYNVSLAHPTNLFTGYQDAYRIASQYRFDL